MVKGTALAKRVVKVLLNRLAGKTEEQIKFLDFLKALEEIYKKDKKIRDLILSEEVAYEDKLKLFEEPIEKSDLEEKELVKELVGFLIKHKAFKYIPLIIRSYQYELENVLGTLKAEIETATELPEEIKKKLLETLEKKLGKKVEAEFKVNPELIGGFVVKTTSFVVEASVKDLLRELALKI